MYATFSLSTQWAHTERGHYVSYIHREAIQLSKRWMNRWMDGTAVVVMAR